MGPVLAKIFFKTGEDDISAKYKSVNDIPVTTINGQQGIVNDHV